MPTHIKTITCQVKTFLYNQGKPHAWIYCIKEGFVLVNGLNAEGKHGITDLYGKGNWFGPGLFDSSALQNAEAQPGCIVERYSKEDFSALLAEQPQQAHSVIEQISRREQQLQKRLFLQQTAALPIRLAQTLSYLFQFQGQACQHGHDRDVYLSQQDLADMVGGSRQSVSQLLSSWKKSGAIDYTRGYICLEDTVKLHQLTGE
ncbi:Crp/Fnr family transcriptional regulator [Sessilibacter corallicola]|uniref:HTH crp-type domain-containing protein n=1 Tax=Sessilibacter corallicola TaxID=2904075 RepID=A0ABQ0ACK5_9GAMM